MRYLGKHLEAFNALCGKAGVDPTDPSALDKLRAKAAETDSGLSALCARFGVEDPGPLTPSCVEGDSPEAVAPCAQPDAPQGSADAQAAQAAALDAELVTQQEHEAQAAAALDAARQEERAKLNDAHRLVLDELATLHGVLGQVAEKVTMAQARLADLGRVLL